MPKRRKPSFIISIYTIVSILLMTGTAAAVVVYAFCRFQYGEVINARYNLIRYSNQVMDASAYLTTEVRAYAATGIKTHYYNYWNEVNTLKNREKGYDALIKTGITHEEKSILDGMLAISNELVSHEARSMEMVIAGNNEDAIGIVYGKFYNESVAKIVASRNKFQEMLTERTEKNVRHIRWIYNFASVATLIMVIATIILQVIQQQKLLRLAYEDILTGGYNYTAFKEKMRGGIGVSGNGYVISADLRGFSFINDTCGIYKGDQLIVEMGKVLANDLRHGELSAHVSGDKFVVFLHSSNKDALIKRIGILRSEIKNLSFLLNIPHIDPVFGIREVDSPAKPENAYSDANLARQRIADRADQYYVFFNDAIRQEALENQKLCNNFDYAIANRQFEMWYQPKYDTKSGKLVAAEALVRWRDSSGKLISPGRFIPLFESNGMISRLDEYTFESVCFQQHLWLGEGLNIVPVSVNVSRASLNYSIITNRYISIIDRYDIPISCIELEITESAIKSSKDIEKIIQQFRSYGFRILVDDFGSGYSSLSTLTKNYFDNIKLDKSLVDCINTKEGDSLLESVVELAHEFNMTVTAEGVEHENQVKFLKVLSCDNIQGYYYSKPLPEDEFRALLAKQDIPFSPDDSNKP